MIQKFVDKFMENKEQLRAEFSERHPEDYKDLVSHTIRLLNPEREYNGPDHLNIHEISSGGYQGTLLYIIPEVGSCPDVYWAVKVSYGSCSACDTLESIRSHSWEDKVEEQQTEDYLTLALHIVQQIVEIGGETV